MSMLKALAVLAVVLAVMLAALALGDDRERTPAGVLNDDGLTVVGEGTATPNGTSFNSGPRSLPLSVNGTGSTVGPHIVLENGTATFVASSPAAMTVALWNESGYVTLMRGDGPISERTIEVGGRIAPGVYWLEVDCAGEWSLSVN
jgi:hypothetical protein